MCQAARASKLLNKHLDHTDDGYTIRQNCPVVNPYFEYLGFSLNIISLL